MSYLKKRRESSLKKKKRRSLKKENIIKKRESSIKKKKRSLKTKRRSPKKKVNDGTKDSIKKRKRDETENPKKVKEILTEDERKKLIEIYEKQNYYDKKKIEKVLSEFNAYRTSNKKEEINKKRLRSYLDTALTWTPKKNTPEFNVFYKKLTKIILEMIRNGHKFDDIFSIKPSYISSEYNKDVKKNKKISFQTARNYFYPMRDRIIEIIKTPKDREIFYKGLKDDEYLKNKINQLFIIESHFNNKLKEKKIEFNKKKRKVEDEEIDFDNLGKLFSKEEDHEFDVSLDDLFKDEIDDEEFNDEEFNAYLNNISPLKSTPLEETEEEKSTFSKMLDFFK